METVQSLRAKGWKIGVQHVRIVRSWQGRRANGISQYLTTREVRNDGLQDFLWVKGGRTVVTVTPPDEERGFKGEAECSLLDNYNKRVGREVALGRALKAWKCASTQEEEHDS